MQLAYIDIFCKMLQKLIFVVIITLYIINKNIILH